MTNIEVVRRQWVNLSARWVGWSRPRPDHFNPGKYPVPIVQEAGWVPGPVWMGAENLTSNGIRSPDRSSRSESLYRLSYTVPNNELIMDILMSETSWGHKKWNNISSDIKLVFYSSMNICLCVKSLCCNISPISSRCSSAYARRRSGRCRVHKNIWDARV